MMQMDKWMLWGACAVMLLVGSFSVHKIMETPKVEPWVAVLEKDLNPTSRQMPPPPPVPAWRNPFIETVKEARPITKGADVPPADGRPVNPPPPVLKDLFVLQFPVLGEVKTNLDGITIAWTLRDAAKRNLPSHVTQKAGKPIAFAVMRQCEDGLAEEVAIVSPDARTYSDLSTEPRMTYRYWVEARGFEIERTSFSEVKKKVTTESAITETRTPSNVRVKLVGGDKTNAVLRVETYDKVQKKWHPKTVVAAQGRGIGTSGWTLKALRFDNFTLVADVTDDEGVDRSISTKD